MYVYMYGWMCVLDSRQLGFVGHAVPVKTRVAAALIALSAIVLPLAIGDGGVAAAAAKPVANPSALVPKTLTVEARVNGDLDGDGDTDAVILAVDGPAVVEDITDSPVDGDRRIIVARKDPGGYVSVGQGAGAAMCRRCGGAFFGIVPAPVDMTIKSGVLVVTQSAGSREVTDWRHRYRIEKGRVRLIGTDRSTTDRANGSLVTTSTNLLTGLTITMVEGTPEEPVKAGRVKGKARLVFIENVELS